MGQTVGFKTRLLHASGMFDKTLGDSSIKVAKGKNAQLTNMMRRAARAYSPFTVRPRPRKSPDISAGSSSSDTLVNSCHSNEMSSHSTSKVAGLGRNKLLASAVVPGTTHRPLHHTPKKPHGSSNAPYSDNSRVSDATPYWLLDTFSSLSPKNPLRKRVVLSPSESKCSRITDAEDFGFYAEDRPGGVPINLIHPSSSSRSPKKCHDINPHVMSHALPSSEIRMVSKETARNFSTTPVIAHRSARFTSPHSNALMTSSPSSAIYRSVDLINNKPNYNSHHPRPSLAPISGYTHALPSLTPASSYQTSIRQPFPCEDQHDLPAEPLVDVSVELVHPLARNFYSLRSLNSLDGSIASPMSSFMGDDSPRRIESDNIYARQSRASAVYTSPAKHDAVNDALRANQSFITPTLGAVLPGQGAVTTTSDFYDTNSSFFRLESNAVDPSLLDSFEMSSFSNDAALRGQVTGSIPLIQTTRLSSLPFSVPPVADKNPCSPLGVLPPKQRHDIYQNKLLDYAAYASEDAPIPALSLDLGAQSSKSNRSGTIISGMIASPVKAEQRLDHDMNNPFDGADHVTVNTDDTFESICVAKCLDRRPINIDVANGSEIEIDGMEAQGYGTVHHGSESYAPAIASQDRAQRDEGHLDHNREYQAPYLWNDSPLQPHLSQNPMTPPPKTPINNPYKAFLSLDPGVSSVPNRIQRRDFGAMNKTLAYHHVTRRNLGASRSISDSIGSSPSLPVLIRRAPPNPKPAGEEDYSEEISEYELEAAAESIDMHPGIQSPSHSDGSHDSIESWSNEDVLSYLKGEGRPRKS